MIYVYVYTILDNVYSKRMRHIVHGTSMAGLRSNTSHLWNKWHIFGMVMILFSGLSSTDAFGRYYCSGRRRDGAHSSICIQNRVTYDSSRRKRYWDGNMVQPRWNNVLSMSTGVNSVDSNDPMDAAADNAAKDDDKFDASDIKWYKRTMPQVLMCAAVYIFHLLVLTQHELVFPFQLFPNDDGRFQSIGFDSIAGMVSLVSMIYYKRKKSKTDSSIDNIDDVGLPWKLTKDGGRREGIAGGLLLVAYFFTGIISELVDEALYILEENGARISIAVSCNNN